MELSPSPNRHVLHTSGGRSVKIFNIVLVQFSQTPCTTYQGKIRYRNRVEMGLVTKWIWVFLALLSLADRSFAASFDCSKANSLSEQAICSDATLSTLDSKLASTYKDAYSTADDQSKAQLIVEQRHWIRYVRDICDSNDCLASSYRDRIAQLAKNDKILINEAHCELIDQAPCRSVVTYRDSAYRIKDFNQSMKSNGTSGEIIGCSSLIDIPVGTRHSNHSFGGYCTIKNDKTQKKVKICNDDMLGHFAMEPAAKEDQKELIEFTYGKCYGG